MMMGKKRISISLNVRYYLNNAKFPIDYENFLRDDKGQSLKPAQARNRLYDALKQGHEVIPYNPNCGNPCKNQSRGCAGFDYTGGGCPGYSIDEDNHAHP